MKISHLSGAVLAGLLAVPAVAQDVTFGQLEYMNACAQCHGADGTGGGPMAAYLTGSLPDLTQLQVNNGGVFPISSLYALIDGSGTMGPHGTREMPAWGDRYRVDATDQLSLDIAVSRETYARTRILALIEHLASIQAE